MEILVTTVSHPDFQLAVWDALTRFLTYGAAATAATTLSVYALLFYSEAGGGR
ncbi:MAG TPA: hypothetical protein VFX96_15420 [Pyrinomonadaceae bacterium]|nr:hypothetical protein [Pyrinomonadaceae bacterium]